MRGFSGPNEEGLYQASFQRVAADFRPDVRRQAGRAGPPVSRTKRELGAIVATEEAASLCDLSFAPRA